MNPWRAALTSATASGNRTRIASRSTSACSSGLPFASTRASAAEVSSTAVFSVSVANCSRWASATDSACCSANSRRPRSRSSGSPPKLNPNPLPSIRMRLAERELVPRLHVLHEPVHGAGGGSERVGERRVELAERLFERPCGGADVVEERGRRDPRRHADDALELERRILGLLDPRRLLGHAQLREARAQLVELAAAGEL